VSSDVPDYLKSQFPSEKGLSAEDEYQLLLEEIRKNPTLALR
jgi:hypothetical protein